MSAKHTPGPWTRVGTLIYAGGEGGGNIAALSELRASRFVQFTEPSLGSPDLHEICANGDLMAAAPELADALELALRRLAKVLGPLTFQEDETVAFAKEALRKSGRLP